MGDAQIEGAAHHGAAVLKDIDAAEVVPQAQRDGRQAQAAAAQCGGIAWCRNAVRWQCTKRISLFTSAALNVKDIPCVSPDLHARLGERACLPARNDKAVASWSKSL